MATNFVSAEVAGGDDVLASQYNNLREDAIRGGADYEVAGGTANAITLAIDATVTTYVEGNKFRFKAANTNTGPATLNVNGIGALTIKKNVDQDLIAGDITSGEIVEVAYDGTNLHLVSRNNNKTALKFGGTGSDGILTVAAGTTTVDLGSARVKVLNYSSINISAGATLTFSNPHASGTFIIIRCQGSAVIAGTITASSFGAIYGAGGVGVSGADADGNDGNTGTNGDELDAQAHQGIKGLKGIMSGAGGAGGAGGLIGKTDFYSDIEGKLHKRVIQLLSGAGAGGGGSGGHNNNGGGSTSGAGGRGGRGGAALLIEIAGGMDFSGTINSNGENGTAGSNGGAGGSDDNGAGGGGGGGAGGHVVMLCGYIVANTGTINTTGGAGGAGGQGVDGGVAGSCSGAGGGGGAGSLSAAGGVGGAGGQTSGDAGIAGTAASGGGAGGAAPYGGGGGGGGAAGTSFVSVNYWFA